MVRLKAVKPGDIVDIVAPSGWAEPKELLRAAKMLRQMGLQPRYPKDLLKKDLFFANTDKRRAEILLQALKAKDSRVVWCLRGGNGAQRLLPHLNKLSIADGKIFIGLSDISVIHNLLNKKNIPSIHGPILTRMGKSHQPLKEKKEVEDLLFAKKREFEYLHLRHLNQKAKRTQIIRAPIVGGNIAVLHSLMGGPKAFYGKNKIVFLEDVNESPYKLDRMLQAMMQAKVFEKAKAIIFGDLTNCAVNAREKKDLKEVLVRFSEAVKIPVVSGIASGHGKLQRPLLLQTKSYLYLGRRPRLLIPSCIYE